MSIYKNIFNFALNAKKLHYGQERYKQIESDSCGTETYSKGGGVAEQVRRAPATVSKWCTNTLQPNFGRLRQVADRHTWRSRNSLFFKRTRLHCKILAYSR